MNITEKLIKEESQHSVKFGTFSGVFVPTVLTILGVIMYLRTGWVVGNAGLGGAILIILLAHVITISTGLSVSSVVTNTRVGAGGAFAIIAQSLGLEVGGGIGVPLALAQTISAALYVLGFSEAWIAIFPDHPFVLVNLVVFALVFGIVYVSAQFAARIQFVILAIVGLSLVSVLLGAFPIGGREGLTQAPQLWGTFRAANFWETFAIFFPAVTGIMVGISLSGSLKDPRRSIPLGTMSAIFLTMVIYLLLVYWLARIATPDDLIENSTVMVDKALWGWAILLGMLGATFSSALGSLVAAPRVIQALAVQKLLPYSDRLASETPMGEPRQALIATGVLAFLGLLVALAAGGLDAVATVITMFFLITYGMLNVVVLIEQALGMVSFRPTFKIPRIVPFIGTAGCLFVMFLINPTFSLVAVVLVLAIYGFLARRTLATFDSDVRSGLFSSLAEWAVVRSQRMPAAPERTWKPMVLAPVTNTQSLRGSYRFLGAMTRPQGGINALGIYPPGQREQVAGLETLKHAFLNDGMYAQATFLESDNFIEGVGLATQVLRPTFFRPNILFLQLSPDSEVDKLGQLIDKTAAYQMGIVLLYRHPVMELGQEQQINVWISNQGPDWQHEMRQSNLDLSTLLAYKLAKNWDGHITLCMAVRLEDEAVATTFLQRLIRLARLPHDTAVHVATMPFKEAIAHTPSADLNIFGLSPQSDLAFSQEIIELVDGSCVFLRDSGEESALA